MRNTVQLLIESDFPVIRRGRLETLQVNLGYKCNQSCLHCHVNAGPNRTEMMDRETLDAVIRFMDDSSITTLDLTGGAPEISPLFRTLVSAAHARGVKVIDRCNLTILLEPDQQGTARFLADNRVRVVASMPCYLKENVDNQRGDGVFEASLAALRLLNGLGYGQAGSGLELDLVFNPQGALLPPPQQALEQDYKSRLAEQYDIHFNHLLTLTNMPIKRFGSTLVSKGKFDAYMALLREAHQDENLSAVMCRSLISIDWQGYVYDCDFNQMLDLPTRLEQKTRLHISELQADDLTGNPIMVADHCYGCTAGQGSGCGGALEP
ncbi:MAG: arsenosugar biosynthesis radical SAM protein ArsS [Zetaproteobacteria bacterium]|nr:arsenosugar biosynthesis radical SAM protein ArsS [Zetaproteobacteria bacterium]